MPKELWIVSGAGHFNIHTYTGENMGNVSPFFYPNISSRMMIDPD